MGTPCCPWAIFDSIGGKPSQGQIIDIRNKSDHQQSHLQQPAPQQSAPQQPGQQQGRFLTYLERLRGEQPTHIDVSSLPNPMMVGNVPTVTLPKALVEQGRRYCEHSLIGRLDFNKVSLSRVRSIAAEVWKPSGDWKVTPLGKGFFMLKLDSKDDFIRIWSQAWKIGDQILYFSKWSPDFDIDRQKSTNALVWVQLPKLGQQHWDYEALMRIAKAVGTPIGVDKKTLARDLGYFANVLVDVDLSKPIPNCINVREEDGGQFSQDIFIPKIPQFCTHCQSVGHGLFQCRQLKRGFNIEENANPQKNEKQNKRRNEGDKENTRGNNVPNPGVNGGASVGNLGGNVDIPVAANIEKQVDEQQVQNNLETGTMEEPSEQQEKEGLNSDIVIEVQELAAGGTDLPTEPDASPGEVQISSNNTPLSIKNAFAGLNVVLLSPTDDVPDSLAGIISEVGMVNARMDEFLNGNHQNSPQTIERRHKSSRGRGRGRSGLGRTSFDGENREEISASSLGPRKSQRDISAPIRLNL